MSRGIVQHQIVKFRVVVLYHLKMFWATFPGRSSELDLVVHNGYGWYFGTTPGSSGS